MANSFMKKDQQLKNRSKDQSVNSKVEEMTKRASMIVEKKNEIDEVKEDSKNEVSANIEVDKPNTRKTDKKKAKSEVNVENNIKGMSTEEFLNLNIQLDRFESNNTSVTISTDIFETIKKYSEIKNLTMNYFVNKLIRVGLEKIDDLSIEEVQKSMCYNAKTRALPFYIDEEMEGKFNLYIENVKAKGYKFSRNSIICALINATLERFKG
ncbi:hypothetical protein ACQPUY_15810 [Clostridium nigeriense]|uniref:hypothetical protein n=1 Tax=Clostridium nigeriense TaxID=1805470 RepID=UPI003D33D08E